MHQTLRQVQRGSIEHIVQLLEDWPESLHDNAAVTKAILTHLSEKKIPAGSLQASDYELARACVVGVTRALQAAKKGPQSSEEHMKKIVDMLVDGLDGVLQWMLTCIRTCGKFAEENTDFLPSCRMLIGHFGPAIVQFVFMDEDLRKAMHASPISPSVVAGLWAWIDPQTRLPPFMIDLNDGYENGCGIIDAIVCYIHNSGDAALAVLRASSVETVGNLHGATANDIVELGILRLRLIRAACRRTERNVPLIGRSLSRLTEAYTNFIETDDPTLLSAIHNRAFLRELTFTIKYVGSYLWNPRDPPTEMSLLSIPLIVKGLPSWTRKAFSSSAAMCHVIQGGLLSILLETLAFVQLTGTGKLEAEEQVTSTYQQYCEGVDTIVGGFLMYPSVIHALSNIFDKKLSLELRQGVLKKTGHWTAELWLSIQNVFERRRELLHNLQLEGPIVAFCDNGEHVTSIGDQDRSRVCSRCHAAVYCSEACQREDWEECHRDDCQALSKVYQMRNNEHRWVHTSTRLFLLAIIQDAFRSTFFAAHKLRDERYPNVAFEDLVYTFNFCIPPYNTDERIGSPGLLDLAGYVELLKGYNTLHPLGIKRLNRLLEDFQAEEQVVIVEAVFAYRDEALYVASRVRIPIDDDGSFMPGLAVAMGGFSYMTNLNLTALVDHLQALREQENGIGQ